MPAPVPLSSPPARIFPEWLPGLEFVIKAVNLGSLLKLPARREIVGGKSRQVCLPPGKPCLLVFCRFSYAGGVYQTCKEIITYWEHPYTGIFWGPVDHQYCGLVALLQRSPVVQKWVEPCVFTQGSHASHDIWGLIRMSCCHETQMKALKWNASLCREPSPLPLRAGPWEEWGGSGSPERPAPLGAELLPGMAPLCNPAIPCSGPSSPAALQTLSANILTCPTYWRNEVPRGILAASVYHIWGYNTLSERHLNFGFFFFPRGNGLSNLPETMILPHILLMGWLVCKCLLIICP